MGDQFGRKSSGGRLSLPFAVSCMVCTQEVMPPWEKFDRPVFSCLPCQVNMRTSVPEVAAVMVRRKEELPACINRTRRPGMLHCIACKWPCTEPGWRRDAGLTKRHVCSICELSWQASVTQVFQALVNLGDVSRERVVSRDAASRTHVVATTAPGETTHSPGAPPNLPCKVEL